ncbi:hypothetical protein Esti_001031 [Eimeria stiedai]
MEPTRAGPASSSREPRRKTRPPGAAAAAGVSEMPECGSTAAAGGRAAENEAPKSQEAVAIEPCRGAEAAAAWERVIRAAPSRSSAESPMPLVLTPLAQRVLQKLRCAYTSRRRGVRPPVLLHGPPGSGKSSYIRWLSQLMGMKQPPVCLFLDQQTEAKSLVGSWVCGRRAGDFEWQEGILSRCVREGRWVVIEQLQQLAHDVHALLHSLAATGYLAIHEQQRRMRAHPEFALFATCAAAAPWPLRKGTADQTSAGSEHAGPRENEAEALDVALTRPPPQLPTLLESWVLLHVPAPSHGDVQRIACRAFPSVSPIVLRLLRSFQAASAVATSGLSRPGQPPSKAVRIPQLRDFLKLCRRLERLSSSSNSSSLFGGFLTDRLRLRIVEEGVAVLLAHINDRALRYRAAVAFAEEWGLQDDQVEAVLFAQRPSLRESEAWLHVGPYYSLPRCSRGEEASRGAVPGSGDVNDLLAAAGVALEETTATAAAEAPRTVECDALTGQQLRLLQQAAGALSCEEPLLLVGDTGAGKTFIVSFVAAKVGVDLVVVNLHQQSENEDLLGRWVPRHPPQEALTLWQRLNKLSAEMLGAPSGAREEAGVGTQLEAAEEGPKAKRRKQQGGQQQQQEEGDRLLKAARHMARQLQQRAARLLQREAYVALLRLALAANTALLQLLRKAGDRLPSIALQQPQQQQQRRTVGELMAACKEIEAAGLVLLEDPALSESSAPTPRSFDSMVEACGLREFLPPSGASLSSDEGGLLQGAPRRRTRCQLHFAFTEGPIIEAVRTGKWLLLDELNLAPPDLLQRLLALLDDPEQPLLVLHGGRPKLVSRHPNFRVFACMNPPALAPPLRLAESKMSFEAMEEEAPVTDKQQQQQTGKKQSSHSGMWGSVGKRELPVEVRQRFTELYVDETDNLEDITTIADAHLRPLAADPPSRLVAELYIHLRCLAESGQLLDGNNKTPCYSLRTLSRALQHAAAILQRGSGPLQLRPALSEGFVALFGSSLDQKSAARVEAVLVKAFHTPRPTNSGGGPSSSSGEVAIELLRPSTGQQPCVSVEGFLIRKGPESIDVCALKKSFVLTPRGQVYLHRIARLLSGSRCALLLEGPTSCGKTSVVSFLAAATGHKCVRINNHEHTDIQEYLGSYAPDAAGRLVFNEGPLTLAVRHGWWVLIDELNLAPSEVLEALNRLLDSNRELVLPTSGEVLKAHADFQLFGTQNPAGVGLYGGRKVLSKALANRFLQLQLEEFGIDDLRLILLNRCKLPASRVEPMLRVFCDLQQRRAKSSVFFGSHGFMTIRDLIRWGRRVGNSPFQHHQQQQQQQKVREFSPMSLEELALEGWLLVGERLRTEEERAIVKESLEKHCLKSTAAKPKRLSVDYCVDPYVAAFRRLLTAKMDWCSQQQKAAAEATAAAAAAAARAASLRSSGAEAALLEEAETAAASAGAAAEEARAAAPELPAFLPFSFNASSLRLLSLTLRALAASENLLLVGETGAGKTAVCELVAWTLQPPHPLQQQQQQQQQQGLEYLLLERLSPSGLYTYNCHLQMEASELLGCMHPVHQGELQQQQHQASLKHLELLRLLEDAPEPELLVPGWLSQLQDPKASAAAAAAAAAATLSSEGSELTWEKRLERRREAARSQLHHFHACFQSAAKDVLICLRAARGSSQHSQQQGQPQQPPLGEDDASLFSRALRKAGKSAARQLEKETEEMLEKALQREKHLQAEVVTAQQQVQHQQAELVRLESQQQQHEEREASHEDSTVVLSGQGGLGGRRQQPQQERQPLEEEVGAARKRQRKGGRNRALRLEETEAAADTTETVPKRRRKVAELPESAATAAAAAASCPPPCAAADGENSVAAGALAAAAAAAAAAVEEGKQQVVRLMAESAAAVAEREDLEVGGAVGVSLVTRLIQQVQQAAEEWVCACRQTRRLFCWKDGPLVRAMKEGALFLLDEASLSQDAVLERLNSVLEEGRHLLLTEQGAAAASNAAGAGSGDEEGAEAAAAGLAVVDVVAAPAFRFVATMNPGGDYGKRELSPALRNRLTEVYVPAFSFDAPDAALLLLQRLRHTTLRGLKLPLNSATAGACCGGNTRQEHERQLQSELLLLQQQQQQQQSGEPDLPLTLLAVRLVLVLQWVKKHVKQPLSIRDAICWIYFIDRFVAAQLEQRGATALAATETAAAAATAKWAVQGFIHGGCLLLSDGLGVGAEMQLTQDGLVKVADDYLLAEAALLEGAGRAMTLKKQQQQEQNDRLLLLREQLRQQLDDASEHPARRSQLAILWLLLTHACRLYGEFGLQVVSDVSSSPQEEEQLEQQQQQQISRAPSWPETRAAFGKDGFAWVREAFALRSSSKPLEGGGGEAGASNLQIGPFSLAAYKMHFTPPRGAGWDLRSQTDEEATQVFDSPSLQRSLGRLLRCLLLIRQQQQQLLLLQQLGNHKEKGGGASSNSGRHAVLLEGPPGAGKTFVVNLLARLCGRRLVRINLSEDTELADLIGSFVPAASGEASADSVDMDDATSSIPHCAEQRNDANSKTSSSTRKSPFVWADGVLTRHLRAGNWVLLDELNLAPQQTLEGLNPLLDHRRCIYLPTADDPTCSSGNSSSNSGDASKKGTAVYAPPGFVLFATQNPHATAASARLSSSASPGAREGVTQKQQQQQQQGEVAQQTKQQELSDVFDSLGLPESIEQRCVGARIKRLVGFSESKAVRGRKGLPQSLLNRFCRIRIDEMLESDMVAVAHKLLNFLHSKQQQQRQQRRHKQQEQEQQDQEQDQLQKAIEERQRLMLSACTVRCVRLMGELSSERPFKGLGGSSYNLRDVTRLIRLLAYKLPCADPRASVTVALMSRLRCPDDLAAAARLVAQCFPRKLFESLGGKEGTQRGQVQQQNNSMELDSVAAVLCPHVAPAAVVAALKEKPSFASAQRQHTGLVEGALPLDLLLLETQEEYRLSLGGVELIRHAGAPAAETVVAAGGPSSCAGIQQQQRYEEEGRHRGLLLHSQRRCAVALAAALKEAFPVLLTGERGGGKSSIVRWLAAACGADVCEVQLAPSIDTSDLLGFYRQVQPRQRLLQAAQDAEQLGRTLIQWLQQQQGQRAEPLQQQEQHKQQQVRDVISSLEALVSASAAAQQRLAESGERAAAEATFDLVEQGKDAQSAAQQHEVLQRLSSSANSLIGGCEAAAPFLPLNAHAEDHVFPGQLSVAELKRRCSRARRCLQEGCALSGLVEKFSQSEAEAHGAGGEGTAAAAGVADEEEETPQFEWVDSVLVTAVREGRWLLLRDSHLCSPSVLDRLNALLEDGGSLLLTEGGSPRLVKRHRNFRIVLTADAAKVHLLSAALRNRCCEVYLKPPGIAASLRLGGQAAEAACDSKQSAAKNGVLKHLSAAPQALLVAHSGPPLLQGLTDRLLRTLAQQLQRAAAGGMDSTPGRHSHDAMLVRWAASLLAGDTEASSHAEHAAATLDAAAAVLHVFGAYIEFYLARNSKAGTRIAAVRLCPLLLQDAYRLLLAGDAGTGQLPLAAAEAMALHHASMQVLLHVLSQEGMLAAFGASLVSARPSQGLEEGRQKQQRQQQRHQQEVEVADMASQALGNVKALLGEATLLTGLQGLQCLAKRVAGNHNAASAAAASWRCLQGWGGAYVAACAFSAKAESFVDSARKVEGGPLPSKAVDEISLNTLSQSFLWQYTAAIEGSGIWRLVLLHLLAACCCCCPSLTAATRLSSEGGRLAAGNPETQSSSSEDTMASANDWIVLRGAVERLTLLQQSRGASCCSIVKGMPEDALNNEVSLLTSAFCACDSRAYKGLALLSAFTRHFLWAAANLTDLERRLHLLQQLQHWDMQQCLRPHRAARSYLKAACEALRQGGEDTLLLPPAVAAAIAPVAVGPVPAHGESLLYAAARLARLSRSGSFVVADEEPVVLLLHRLVRLLCHESIAMLLPESLHLLQARCSNSIGEVTQCAAGIHGAACSACGNKWRDSPCCLFSALVAEQGEEQLNSALQDIPHTMRQLYKGLQQLKRQAVSAASAALVSCAAATPARAAVAVRAAEQCTRLTRAFRAWTAALQLLCLPLCGCSCQSGFEVALEQRSHSSSSSHWSSKHPWQSPLKQRRQHGLAVRVWEQLILRIKGLAVSLGDIADAQTQKATTASKCAFFEDSKRGAAVAGDDDVVTAELLTPLSHLCSALLFELRQQDVNSKLVKPQAVAADADTSLLFAFEGQQQRDQTHRVPAWTKEGTVGSAVPLLPPAELDLHARSVRSWLLLDILQALALGVATVTTSAASEPAAAGIAAGELAKEQMSFYAQQPAALLRRFGTSAPALGRGQDLLKLAIAALGEDSVPSASPQREEFREVKPCLSLFSLPQPRFVLPHASALLALLLSSSVLRARGRDEAAEKLETQIAEFLLPVSSTSRSKQSGAELLCGSRKAAMTAAAVRAAAAAEGVLQSRFQHWIGLSRLAMVSVSVLQAQLAARAAVCLGVQHAAELLLLHLESHLQQQREPAVAAGESKAAAAGFAPTSELPLVVEQAAQEQLLRQQHQWLPLFTSPAAAFSLSLEDTVLGQACSGLGTSIPVPPALLEATAVLTATSWKHRQQHQQQQQDIKEKKDDTCCGKALGSSERTVLAAAGNVAVETLCCMWRTEVDVHSNDALRLQQVLQLQESLQEGKAADACGQAAQPASLLTQQTWGCLAEAAGGLPGAGASTHGQAAALISTNAQSASTSLAACGSCAFTARIVAEVQQHATVSSAAACFLAVQRLRQQLRHLDEDSCRGAARLLSKAVRTEQPSRCLMIQEKGELADASSLATCSDGLRGDTAEWAAAVGFCCFMWSLCPPNVAACLSKSKSTQTGGKTEATGKPQETGDAPSRRRASSLLILRVLNSCWQGLWKLLSGSAAAPVAVASTAQELRRLVVEPLQTCVAAPDAPAPAAAPAAASEGKAEIHLEATRSAIATLSLLLLVLDRCSQAANPDDVLRGVSGMYLRGLLLLLLGRWAALSAAASVAADLEEQKAVATWRLSLKKEITSYETEREALLLRAAAIDGCDGRESLTAASGPATSASATLVDEAEAHAAALQQLLDCSQEADPLLKVLSRSLPLRPTDIPKDLATRLTRPWLLAPSEAAVQPQPTRLSANSGAAAAKKEAAGEPCTQVLNCLSRRAAVDVEPQAALAAWWEELVVFAESALSHKSLSAQLPDLAILLSGEERGVRGSWQSSSATALRAAAEAAASCSSRLQSNYPLLCGAAVHTATVGLLAVAKGFLTVSLAARSSRSCGLSSKAVREPGSCGGERSAASPPNGVLQLRTGTMSFPSLPFAALTSSSLYDALSALQPIRRVQWLLLWLHAESAAATAAEISGSRRAGRQLKSALSTVASHSSLSSGARLVLAGLLEQLAQRHLAWRQQQEIAADQTASLLQRLEGLVIDRAGQCSSRANAEAAEELFPCADEWGALEKEKQQHRVLQEEAADDDGTTQYTAWCRQNPQGGAEHCPLKQGCGKEEQLEGLSEADLLLLWGRAVETGVSWTGNSTSREADVEAAATAMYREALTGSLCILLELHNAQPEEAMNSLASAKPLAAVAPAAVGGELSAPSELDVACAPHLQALLAQMSARLVDESPLRQQQEEQQLKQLLLLQEEEVAVTADSAQQETGDLAAPEKGADSKHLEQQLQQERLQQQRERARKLRFAQLCRRVALPTGSSGRSNSGAATSFYSPGNATLLQPLCRPVQQLQEAAASFAEVVEDHPALQGLLLLAQRVSSLSLSATSPADALTALEGLLDRAAAWQNAMDRHHLAHLVSLHCERQFCTAAAAAEVKQQQDKHSSNKTHAETAAEAEESGAHHRAMATMEQQDRAAMHAAERLLQRFDVAVGAVERQVLLLRRRQLVEWHFLRDFREERMHRHSLRFAPFLWVLLPDDEDPARPSQIAAAEAAAAAAATAQGDKFNVGGSHEAAGTVLLRLIGAAPVGVADVLMRFLRTSPLGQFEGRLLCMEAASQYRRLLLQTAQHVWKKGESKGENEAANAADGTAIVAVTMGAVARFAVAAGWRRAVQQQLHIGRKEMDREVSALASLARWNLSSRMAMKASVHKTHVQLAKHVRKFDDCLQMLTAAAVASSEGRLQEQLVAAALALPLRSPLAVARQAAAKAYDESQQQDRRSSPQGATTADAMAAAASVDAVHDFLQQTVPGLNAKESLVQSSSLADLHAFSLSSASASDVAAEVQAICQEFAAAVKEASAAAAREAEEQQQQQQQGEPLDAETADSEPKKKKPAVSRQQIQRRFADLRLMLRSTLKLPCLFMCGGAPGLLAAALNDASGLPEASASVHPLRHAAGLQQHDTAAMAAAALPCTSRAKGQSCAEGGAVRAPIGELLGGVWSSASQQWYLMLQTLLQCQQLASPHRDVVAHRNTLLGYAAALVLHILQQRNRCWRAAAEYQDLVDAVSLSLTGPSAQICAEKVARLLTAAETLQEALRQARAVLPSEREAAVQNDALAAIDPPSHEAVNGAAANHGVFRSPSGVVTASGEHQERRLLQHNLRELHAAHRSIKNALRALQPALHLLRETPEGRRLATARVEETAEHMGKRRSIRVRVQWLRDVEAACAATLECLLAAGLSQLLPSHATVGLRRVCDTLSSSCTALTEEAEAARREAEPAAHARAFASAVKSFDRSIEVIAAKACRSPQPGCGSDRLLQLATHPETEGDNGDLQQQPVFDALPLPPLSALFPFKDMITALSTFDEAAPSYIHEGLLLQQQEGTSKAATTTLYMLQRAAGVLLSAFDGLEGTVRIGLSLMQLVLVLLQLGWGYLSNEEEAAAAAARRQQKQKDEWVSGTGLGDGEGVRDASEQIEEEWQFDGLKDEKQDPQQRPPEKPKSEEQDKALEISLEFEGEASAPLPKEQEGQQQQQRDEEAQQERDDVAGSVDLQQGGEIEDKRWAGSDEDDKEEEDRGPDSKTQKQEEDIQTEGGHRQGGVEMEGAKEDADNDGPQNTTSKPDDAQNRQQVEGEKQAAEEETTEDGGKLEVNSPEGYGDGQQPKPEYQRKLQKENPTLSEEETIEDTGEKTAEADDAGEGGEEAGDSADGQGEQQHQQQVHQLVRDEGISEDWGEDLQLEDDVVLDETGGEDEQGADDDAVERSEEAAPQDDGQEDEGVRAATSELSGVDETKGDDDRGQQQQQHEGADRGIGQPDQSDKASTAEGSGAADAQDDAKEEEEGSHKDAEEEQREEEDGREGLRQDPSVQGLAAPIDDTEEPGDDNSQAGTQKRQLPPKREDRQRMAFGVDGEGSLVQREVFEGDADGNDATGEHAASSDGQQNGTGNTAAAVTADGGSLARDGADSSQHSQAPSNSKQLPPNMLPENPLEDDSAVERWLQRVHLLQQGEGQPDENAGGGTDAEQPEQMDVEGQGTEAGGDCRDEGGAPKEQSSSLQRGQLCQKDEAAGSQEVFAETSEAAATKPTPNAKLADSKEQEEESELDLQRAEQDESQENVESERIFSTLSCGEAVEEARENENKSTLLAAQGEAEAEGESVPADGEAEEEEAEASEQLYSDLIMETDTDKDLLLKQREDKPEPAAAKVQEGRDASEDEEERMAAMAADLEERMALDEVGKEDLLPERAASLWHLLENRTAASAAALSESLRLVLQPTATGGWEGGYRSGKKLSLRRVLAFVASSQRDDRLWLRRRRPRGLQYRVLVGVDCSRSMQQLNAAASALEAVVLLAQTFNHLQIGTFSVCTFGGAKPEVCVHPTPQLSAADGQRLVQRCSFREESHKSHEVAISDLLQLAIHELEKDSSSNSNSNSMILILSDGRFNKEVTHPWVNAAIARRCIPLLVILDPPQPRSGGSNSVGATPVETATAASAAVTSTGRACVAHSTSIFDLKQVQQQPGGGLQVTPYLQYFPFPYYAVVNDAQQLPSVLADVIRQWVEAAANDW